MRRILSRVLSNSFYLSFALLVCGACASGEDLTGRWLAGSGPNVFVLRQTGDTLTGVIEGEPGGRTYRIVDGKVRGNQVVFFVLHEAEDDPEVQANAGNPFHNIARGTVRGDELTIEGSRENTTIRQYKQVLKRLRK